MPNNYDMRRDLLLHKLKMLPPTELHYYFALLVAAIENEEPRNREKHLPLLDDAINAVEQLNKYYIDVRNQKKTDLEPVLNAINALILTSKMQTPTQKVKKAVIAVCSVLLGFVIGTVGASVGFIAGLLSDYTLVGNVKGSGYGFLTGMVMGAFVGSRGPDLAFQNSFERKLEFCVKHINKIAGELPLKRPHAEYEEETKQYILDTFFKDVPESEKEAVFKAFLMSTQQEFQVSTTLAGFVSAALKGHLGHHNLIAYSINGKYHTPMEYGDRFKTPSFFDQNESKRIITGQKLFDMLVLDRILQETYAYSLRGVANDYDLGSNDCRTYVDKLLIGTGQAPTKIPRFNPKVDKVTGTYIIGPIVRFFSKTSELEMEPLIPYYKADPNEPDPIITERKWDKRKKATPGDEPMQSPVPMGG